MRRLVRSILEDVRYVLFIGPSLDTRVRHRWCRYFRFAPFALLVLFVAASACASQPEREPTIDDPLMGCIMPTAAQRNSVPGKMMPEPVRIIGYTAIDDGHRLMVTRGPNFDPAKWEPHNDAEVYPHDPGAVHRGAICGPEVKALDDMFSASRGDGAAAQHSIPPR
jgi:hypothetical protein